MCLCPSVEAMQSLGHRPSMCMEIMPPTLVSENSVLFNDFIHLNVVGSLLVCLSESYIITKQKVQ